MNNALSQLGLRSRLFLISAIPLLAITVTLSWFSVQTRHSDLNDELEQFGTATVEYLASGAQFGLFAGDQDTLSALMKAPLATSPDVHGLAFLDSEHSILVSNRYMQLPEQLLARLQVKNGPGVRPVKHAGHRYFYRSVMLAEENITDFDDPASEDNSGGAPVLLGWVVLDVSEQRLLARQRNIILTSLAVALAGLALSALLAARISRSIAGPIQQLTTTVERIESGDADQRAPEVGPPETRILARVVNRLANTSQSTTQELQLTVERATSQLRSAMENLSTRNQELEHARDDLQAALTAKDDFLARMSHEMRTPLTTVIGYTRLFGNTDLADDQREYNRNIIQASNLLLATIDDILDFAKLQSNALQLNQAEFDLEASLDDLIAMHAHNAHQKSLELVQLVEVDVPTKLLGDSIRIKQIISNLLSNAIKFTAQGEVVLRVALEATKANTAELLFSVKDSGPGIPADTIPRLFQPFRQADETITRRFGGSGLGLAICKQLVELMAGNIQIESTVDVGTEVTFCLPLTVVEDESLQHTAELPTNNLRVLLYDSNPWSRRAQRAQLARFTPNVYAVRSIAQVHELLGREDNRFDLVVLGLNVAELQAVQLAELLSRIRIQHSASILLLASATDVASHVPENTLLEFAPLYCLSKPVRRERMLGILELISGTAQTKPQENRFDQPGQQPLQGLTVLIAEDNRFNRKLIKEILNLYGAEAIEAADGAAAIASFSATSCDLVLMDIHMPQVDGVEATRKIVELATQQRRSVPVIALTADFTAKDQEDMLQAGALDILHKPIDEQELLATICELTGRQVIANSNVSASIFNSVDTSPAALQQELTSLTTQFRKLLEGDQNQQQLRGKLHEMSGLCGLFGMAELRSLVAELREAALQGHTAKTHYLLTRVEAEISSIDNAAVV
ncbi:MAG: ATP-binding protein [Pseudomonadales bacterium]